MMSHVIHSLNIYNIIPAVNSRDFIFNMLFDEEEEKLVRHNAT